MYLPTIKKDLGPLSSSFIGFIIIPIFKTSNGCRTVLTIIPANPPNIAWFVSDYALSVSTI